MSVVRFAHTDALRLGSPVAGLAESPDWLRKVASSAVRAAVTNLIEAAVAGRCQLVVIAGQLTESTQDLDLAVSWLAAQTAVLQDHGIRLVLCGHSESDHAALRRLDAILVAPGQRLDVWSNAADRIDCVVTPRTVAARPGWLGIEVASMSSARPMADLAYVAVPAVESSAMTNSFDGVASAHDRHLRLSAGSPQSISPSERGVFGCQFVEADLSRQTLTARFVSTDVIRFAQELVTCRPGVPVSQRLSEKGSDPLRQDGNTHINDLPLKGQTPFRTATRLCDLLRERSRAIATSGRCTMVVEWVIDGQFALSPTGSESLSELALLRDLRGSLHGGHAGAWPYRIRFSDNSTLDISGHRSLVAHEFSAVIRDRMINVDRRCITAEHGVIGTPLGAGSEAAVGLDVLWRVA